MTQRPATLIPGRSLCHSGNSTAGQLLKDKQLYENMNGVVVDLRTLVDAIKKDPKKYLNVKVSIF